MPIAMRRARDDGDEEHLVRFGRRRRAVTLSVDISSGGGARIGAARAAPNAPPPLRFMMSSTRASCPSCRPSPSSALSARMSMRPEPSPSPSCGSARRVVGSFAPSVSAESEKRTLFSLRWPVSFCPPSAPRRPPPPLPRAAASRRSSSRLLRRRRFATLPKRSAPCPRPPPRRAARGSRCRRGPAADRTAPAAVAVRHHATSDRERAVVRAPRAEEERAGAAAADGESDGGTPERQRSRRGLRALGRATASRARRRAARSRGAEASRPCRPSSSTSRR